MDAGKVIDDSCPSQSRQWESEDTVHRTGEHSQEGKGTRGKADGRKNHSCDQGVSTWEDSTAWGGPSIYPELLRDLTLHTASHSSLAHPLQGTEFLLLHPWYPSNTAQKLMGPGGGRGQQKP